MAIRTGHAAWELIILVVGDHVLKNNPIGEPQAAQVENCTKAKKCVCV